MGSAIAALQRCSLNASWLIIDIHQRADHFTSLATIPRLLFAGSEQEIGHDFDYVEDDCYEEDDSPSTDCLLENKAK